MIAMFGLGGSELILILGVALLLFGGKKLPELAKGLGQGIREFKKATDSASDEIRHAVDGPVPAPARRSPPAVAGSEDAAPHVAQNPRA
jgi:sec-independent protein translocase protein TatA